MGTGSKGTTVLAIARESAFELVEDAVILIKISTNLLRK